MLRLVLVPETFDDRDEVGTGLVRDDTVCELIDDLVLDECCFRCRRRNHFPPRLPQGAGKQVLGHREFRAQECEVSGPASEGGATRGLDCADQRNWGGRAELLEDDVGCEAR